MDSNNIFCRIIFILIFDFTLDKLNEMVLRRAPAGAKLWEISQAGFLSKFGEKIHNVEISWNWYLWNNAQCLWNNAQWKFVKNFTLSVKNFTMKVCEIMHNVCENFLKVCEKINLIILSKSIYFFKNNCYNIYIRLRKTTWKRK